MLGFALEQGQQKQQQQLLWLEHQIIMWQWKCTHLHLEPVVVELVNFWFNERWRVSWLLLVTLHVSIGDGCFTVDWMLGCTHIVLETEVNFILRSGRYLPSMAKYLWIMLSRTGVWQTYYYEVKEDEVLFPWLDTTTPAETPSSAERLCLTSVHCISDSWRREIRKADVTLW